MNPLTRAALSPVAFLIALVAHRRMLRILVRREVRQRYADSILGLAWIILLPFMLMAVYGGVLGGVLGVRFPGYGETPVAFAAALFCGLITYQYFAETLNTGPRLIVGSPALVKNFDVPVELAPAAAVFARSISFAAAFVVLGVVASLLGLTNPLRALGAFALALPMTLAALGIAWLTSAIGAYVRDLQHNVGPLATALLFLSAVFYPLGSAPGPLTAVLVYNPLAVIVDATRVMLMTGAAPDWFLYGRAVLIAWVLAWLGWVVFNRVKAGFADVI